MASAAKSGLGSLATKMRGGYKSQSAYEKARDDRRAQNRVNNVAARLAANKKTLSNPYSIAKTQEQRDQIKDAINEGAKKDHSQGQTGYGSCFIAGTKVSMADGTSVSYTHLTLPTTPYV